MNRLLKTLIAGISALTMCISVMPLSANADEIDVNALQEEFNEVQSSNPDYMEYTYYDLESGTASNLAIDNNEEDLQEYFNAQEQFDNFISTCSIAAGNDNGLHVMTETDNKIGWVTSDGSLGTGFLIGNDLVLTAAHCLQNHITGKYVDFSTVEFSAGVYGGAELVSSKARANGIFVPSKFKESGKDTNWKYDYAIIKLDKSIGKYPSIGYYDIGIPTSTIVGKSITAKGYGYDENINPNSEYPLYSNGIISSITAENNKDRVSFTAYTSPGMSGGPVIDNADNTAIAIVSTGTGTNLSYGTKIIGSIYRFTMVDFDKAINMPLE